MFIPQASLSETNTAASLYYLFFGMVKPFSKRRLEIQNYADHHFQNINQPIVETNANMPTSFLKKKKFSNVL